MFHVTGADHDARRIKAATRPYRLPPRRYQPIEGPGGGLRRLTVRMAGFIEQLHFQTALPGVRHGLRHAVENAAISAAGYAPLQCELEVPVLLLSDDAGAHLAGHPQINHLTFTGSVETGIAVMKAAAQNVVPVTLELGGKSPNIVFADAHFEAAITGAMKAIFSNAGQVCSAGSRLLIQEEVHERFVQELAQRTARLRLGSGLTDPDIGPVVSEEQFQRVLNYLEIGKKEGAKIVMGGEPATEADLQQGFFIQPTLFDAVRPGMRIEQEEIFGPVLSIIPFREAEDATHIANDVSYGLVAAVWTRDIGTAHRLAAEIKAGQIYINNYFGGGVGAPFGGYKKSGFGREKGMEALHSYTQVKNVCVTLD